MRSLMLSSNLAQRSAARAKVQDTCTLEKMVALGMALFGATLLLVGGLS